MRYRTLGDTGVTVSEYCFGAMMLGAWGNTDHDEGVRMIHTALEAGVNFVDTADMYSGGESEEIVGKALASRRDDVVLASKAHFPMGDDPNRRGNSRRWIVRAVEDSLRRLGTDRIDLYQIHRFDPSTDVDETLGALSDLVRAGKVVNVGSSVFPAERIVEAQWVARERGHVRFRTEQPPYSLLQRGIESAVLPTAQRYGMGVLTWGPLGSGWLSGKYTKPSDVDLNSGRRSLQRHKFDPTMPGNARKLAAVAELSTVAGGLGVPLSHLALAFVRAHPAVSAAIIGPRTPEQLADLLAAVDLTLDESTLDAIDKIVEPGVDLNFLDADHVPAELTDPSLRRR